MTNCRTAQEEALHVEEQVCQQPPGELRRVDQVPVLVSLPELATVAGQRKREQKSLRGQIGRLKMLNWRRLAAGLGSNLVVGGILFALTAATYWRLSDNRSRLFFSDVERTAVQDQRGKQRQNMKTTGLTFSDESTLESGNGSGQQISGQPAERGDLDSVDVVIAPRRLNQAQLIVQPVEPILSARRNKTSQPDRGRPKLNPSSR